MSKENRVELENRRSGQFSDFLYDLRDLCVSQRL
jgi:hypothetical protein